MKQKVSNKIKCLIVLIAVFFLAFAGFFLATGNTKKADAADTTVHRDVVNEAFFSGVWKATGWLENIFTNEYGNGFLCTNLKIYNTTNRAWPDKFGMNFRIEAYSNDGIDIILSSKNNVWYENDNTVSYFKITLTPKNYTDVDTITDATVVAYNGVTKQSKTLMTVTNYSGWESTVHWNNTGSKYDSKVAFSKTEGKLTLSLGGMPKETTDSAVVDFATAVFANFTGMTGYVQVNLKNSNRFTFRSLIYGVAKSGRLPDGWTNGGVLDNLADTLLITEDELFGWTSNGNKYSLTAAGYRIPLNGFDLKLRAAHGSGTTELLLMLCSAYQDGWYTATYSLGLQIHWLTGMPNASDNDTDDTAHVDFLCFDKTTYKEDTLYGGKKFTQEKIPFHWFDTNEIRLYLKQGRWCLTINDFELFFDQSTNQPWRFQMPGAEGYSDWNWSFGQYCDMVNGYFTSAGGLLNIHEASTGNGIGTYIITEMEYIKNELYTVSIDAAEFLKYNEKTYNVGQTATVDLTKLFVAEKGKTDSFFATKGTVTNGVWTYSAKVPEDIAVTFIRTNGGGKDKVKMFIHFTETRDAGQMYASDGGGSEASPFMSQAGAGASVKKGGCSGEINYSALTVGVLAAALAVSLLAIKRRACRKDK